MPELNLTLARLPYPPYLWQVTRRSLGIWVLVRSAYVVVLLVGVAFFGLLPFAEGTTLALHPALATRAMLIVLSAVLVWWDRRRSQELLLPANMGAWSGWFWTASLLAALILDVALQALLQAL